ncbi:site-specific DNA-methyltransferase [Bradyrhizobium sp. KB893862 SZCCT0404]|uniref:DNA-methyltransferase n=1 Tax=Bradyrhizobium sp. KB893862 SZCCT0404 TaxID=2807672 RepID=UPI001BA51FF2|nr:site-specific DNA-methyltransferase [Bradyrhizobium sp. KB893862 SZCCT0404]MBR1172786.1 site-specific DNA-methyltransferase [Bradyrhizobium sp. KB893862 SZCCT0404]
MDGARSDSRAVLLWSNLRNVAFTQHHAKPPQPIIRDIIFEPHITSGTVMDTTEIGGATLLLGKCEDRLRELPDNSVDAIVTDPPYGLEFMGKDWDAPWKTDRRQVFDGTLTDVRANPFGRSKIRYGSGASYGAGSEHMRAFQAWATEIFAECLRVLKPGGYLLAFGGSRTYHRMACAVEDAGFEVRDQIMWVYGSGFPKSHNGDWGGTALKPAHEPIVMARKPLVGTVEANWRQYRTGALNVDECRIGDADGRWPANLIHDGSDEVLASFPTAPDQQGRARTDGANQGNNTFGALKHVTKRPEPRGDVGSAARFFYCAKASKKDRGEDNIHPTVKPTDLMRYLCRLVTPPGGTVLDPFMGSGSTGKAAILEGLKFIGCELSQDYLKIAEGRILAAAQIDTTSVVKAHSPHADDHQIPFA